MSDVNPRGPARHSGSGERYAMNQIGTSETERLPKFEVLNEDGELLCRSEGLDHFFVSSLEADPGWNTFLLAGCRRADPLAGYCGKLDAELGNVEIRILDKGGFPIGAYEVSSITVKECRPHPGEPALLDVAVNGLFFSHPHPKASLVWERWRTRPPATCNEWAKYDEDGRKAWLDVVRHAFRFSKRGPDRASGHSYQLDGLHVTGPVSFYCALGEAINGPGGYFGAGLDELADCLRGGFGATIPFRLKWNESKVARASPALGDSEVGFSYGASSYLDALLNVLMNAGVSVEL